MWFIGNKSVLIFFFGKPDFFGTVGSKAKPRVVIFSFRRLVFSGGFFLLSAPKKSSQFRHLVAVWKKARQTDLWNSQMWPSSVISTVFFLLICRGLFSLFPLFFMAKFTKKSTWNFEDCCLIIFSSCSTVLTIYLTVCRVFCTTQSPRLRNSRTSCQLRTLPR
jgi:hypothetical protein